MNSFKKLFQIKLISDIICKHLNYVECMHLQSAIINNDTFINLADEYQNKLLNACHHLVSFSICVKCKRRDCHSCTSSDYCSDCNDYYCRKCADWRYCTECLCYLCHDCSIICNICNNAYCFHNEHIFENSHYSCSHDKLLCGACKKITLCNALIYCENCGSGFCSSDSLDCNICFSIISIIDY